MSLGGQNNGGGASTIAEITGLQVELDSKVTQNMFNDVITDLATYDYVDSHLINKLDATATAVNSNQLGGKTLATIETERTAAITLAINNIIAGAPAAYDTLLEIANYIASDISGAAAMNTAINNRVQYADIIDNLVTAVSNKPLSANQGKLLNEALALKAALNAANTFTQEQIFRKTITVNDTVLAAQALFVKSDNVNAIARFRNNATTTTYVEIDTNGQKIQIFEAGANTTLQQIAGNTALINSSNNSLNIQSGLAGLMNNIILSAAGVDVKTGGTSQLTINNSGIIDVKKQIRWGSTAVAPMLFNSGAELQVKLGDNSGFTTIMAQEFKFNQNAQPEVNAASHYFVIRDKDGGQWKLLAVPLG